MERHAYTAPKFAADGFNCPYLRCGAYAHQEWYSNVAVARGSSITLQNARVARCGRCGQYTHWIDEKLIFPAQDLEGDSPHADLPAECVPDFEEARSIGVRSPRGAAALLRLVVQKLMPHLGEKGENLNRDIASLVSKGLPADVQMALDACRVIGNNAVHPGEMALTDTPEIAAELLRTVNFIVDDRIRRPKDIAALYRALPPGAIEEIAKRDKQPAPYPAPKPEEK